MEFEAPKMEILLLVLDEITTVMDSPMEDTEEGFSPLRPL